MLTSIDRTDERLARAEPVTIYRDRDEELARDTFRVDRSPLIVLVSRELLRDSEEQQRWGSPVPIRREGDVIRWEFDNCRCRYRVLGYVPSLEAFLCERLGNL